MKPDISEFSYGYGFTEELARMVGPFTSAPEFPSLKREGQKGGGYDLRIDLNGTPLFLQFKLSDFMVRRSTWEIQQGLFNAPFYRMHLRPRRHSKQHQLLLELEAGKYHVFYAAPVFHKMSELNEAYVNNQILARSIFIRPSAIGALPDDDSHHISFAIGGPAYRISEPIRIKVYWGGEALSNQLTQAMQHGDTAQFFTEADSQRLLNTMVGILERWLEEEWEGIVFSRLPEGPLEKIAYLARTFFSCEFYVMRRKNKGVTYEKDHQG